MRFTLAAHATERPLYDSYPAPLTVQIKPSRSTQGQHVYTTDSRTLLTMLKGTDLSGIALEDFMKQLKSGTNASLSGVNLKDSTLRQIGYFVD